MINRKTLIAAAGFLTLSALPALAAEPPQSRPQQPPAQSPQSQSHQGHGAQQDQGRNDNRGQSSRDDNRYGQWNDRWGARPPAPPRHFTRTSDWYRHVRACQQRYRTYDARTDRYIPRRGQTAICRL